jgi:hypothetical protein
VITVPEGAATDVSTAGDSVGAALAQESAQDILRVRSVKREQPSGFATMAIASFGDQGALENWQVGAGATLAAPLVVRAAGVMTAGGTLAPAPSSSVFKISYYTLTAPLEAFRAWVDGYLSKYLEAQRSAGILKSYVMYLEEGASGRALLVLEYPDAIVEKEAEPRKAKLGDELARRDPEYARQEALKEGLRTTQSWTLATPMP